MARRRCYQGSAIALTLRRRPSRPDGLYSPGPVLRCRPVRISRSNPAMDRGARVTEAARACAAVNQRTRIKICGVSREADIAAAVEAGADAVGFVFHPSSPRFVAPERAAQLARALPPFVTPVGLFVNAADGRSRGRASTIPRASSCSSPATSQPEACNALQSPLRMRAARRCSSLDLLDFAPFSGEAQGLHRSATPPSKASATAGAERYLRLRSLVPVGVPRP